MDRLAVRLHPFTESDLELFDRFATDSSLSEPFEWVGVHLPAPVPTTLAGGPVARLKPLLSGCRGRG